MRPADRLIVALDVPDAAQARALVARLSGSVGLRFFKVGSQLFTAAGPELVRELVGHGHRVFLDLKLHDIPQTVARAATEAARLGADLLTVHALGGAAMLEAAVAVLAGSPTRLLAITILTSHDDASLERLGLAGGVAEHVVRLARQAREAGVHGVVASPLEVGPIRQACGRDFLIVTPGIRPAGSHAHDQARAATPSAALAAGADYLVLGRPIVEAADPAEAAKAILDELAAAI